MAAVAQRPTTSYPELGSNVAVFRPTDDMAADQAKIDAIYAGQQHSEFGSGRYALLFAPGTYRLRIPVGFYTQVLGLGALPDAVRIEGDLRVDAAARNDNATTTFWRGAEGMSVTPESGTMQWAVSQAVEFRRMHVHGDMVLNQRHGWASGGWMSDSAVDGTVNSGTQQQWISRNSEWKQWSGSNWNMVFVGTPRMPEGDWPQPTYTKVERTPVVREKPFLEQQSDGSLAVRVPGLRQDSSGVSWSRGAAPGRVVPMRRFYVARADRDTAASMNAALQRGRNLLLTPGIYQIDQPIRVTHQGAIVLGLGFATLHAVHGTEAMTVSDVDGVTVAGLLFDAGEEKSPSLLHVGTAGTHRRHAGDPIVLHDVFFRVGGAATGKVSANLIIDSDDTIVDHTWIWRADHGRAGVGWTVNESDNGLVVRGDRVTVYGLFVEHHEKNQVLWSGEAGRTYFYQSEIPYDPPTQAAWTDDNGARGWASYKVAQNVKRHEGWGFGVYSVFRHPDVVLDRAIEVPKTPEVRVHHMITVALDNLGAIENVIDDRGGPTQVAPHRVTPKVAEFP